MKPLKFGYGCRLVVFGPGRSSRTLSVSSQTTSQHGEHLDPALSLRHYPLALLCGEAGDAYWYCWRDQISLTLAIQPDWRWSRGNRVGDGRKTRRGCVVRQWQCLCYHCSLPTFILHPSNPAAPGRRDKRVRNTSMAPCCQVGCRVGTRQAGIVGNETCRGGRSSCSCCELTRVFSELRRNLYGR